MKQIIRQNHYYDFVNKFYRYDVFLNYLKVGSQTPPDRS